MRDVDLAIRKYLPGEERLLRQLFVETIRAVNKRDYSAEQLEAWIQAGADQERWRARIESCNPFVALAHGNIVGFADVQEDGYIDFFFVHRDWQGKGVGRQLFQALNQVARDRGMTELRSNVSITARPFFESRGFHVVAPQEVKLGKIVLRNYRMKKVLGGID